MEKQLGWTTIEQSKKLVEMGLDSDTADMSYLGYSNTELSLASYSDANERFKDKKSDFFKVTPCWSLGRLIGLIPNNYRIALDINYQRFSVSNEFSLSKRRDIHSGVCVFHTDNNNLIDSVVEAIIWLLENNHIKKEKKTK